MLKKKYRLTLGVYLNVFWCEREVSGLWSFSEEVQRRLASPRDCVGSTRLQRLVLAAAGALAGSAIDEKFQAPPLTSDTHSLVSSACP